MLDGGTLKIALILLFMAGSAVGFYLARIIF